METTIECVRVACTVLYVYCTCVMDPLTRINLAVCVFVNMQADRMINQSLVIIYNQTIRTVASHTNI